MMYAAYETNKLEAKKSLARTRSRKEVGVKKEG